MLPRSLHRLLPPPALTAFVVYAALAVGLTWPVARDLDGGAIGHVGNDTWNHLWGFWWVKDELVRQHQFPISTHLINHPHGGSLYFIDLANALLSLPLQMAVGLVASYNLVILFQLTLNAFGAWLLANHLVRSAYAAFVAGLIYGFSPHLLAQAHNGISETLNAGLLPIYLLFFLKTLHEPPRKNAVFAGIFLFLNTFFNWYYGLFALLFSGLYVVGTWVRQRRFFHRAVLERLGIQGFIYTLGIIPFLMLFRATLSSADALVGRDPEFVWQTLLYHNMTDLLIFFHPGRFYSPDLKGQFGEDLIIVAYLGYSALALAALAVVLFRQREVKLWAAITAVFFVFALGPYLYVDGRYVEISNRWIPLPFLLFFKAVPLFSRISHPFRFVVMVQLGLGLLAAYGLKGLLPRGRVAGALVSGAAGAAILLETALGSPAVLPMPTSPAHIPRFYERLAEEADPTDAPFAILDLPVGVPNLRRAVYTYYQTAHSRPVPYSLNDPFPSALKDSYFMRYMVNLEFVEADQLSPLIPELDLLAAVEALKADGYRYVVVHDDLYAHPDQGRRVHQFLELFVGEPQRYPDDHLVVYRLK